MYLCTKYIKKYISTMFFCTKDYKKNMKYAQMY